ncbi:MAG: hypothetical protein LQ346_008641 [Caloplaca aetnensis]|nr:MAG: hypothetical protein LQ346_008641 [Caloplaca aetnensis]
MLLLLLLCGLLFLAAKVVYNLYFHVLSPFRGPLLWKAFRFPFVIQLMSGTLPHRVRAIHEEYGSYVRVGPNELSITDPAAWKDIYATNFQRAPQYSNKPPGKDAENFISATKLDHARFRKVLAPAFSERSIQEYEAVIVNHVDTLVQKVREEVDSKVSKRIDMLKWYNYTTLDVVGEFIWSSSFGCLAHDRYPPWLRATTQFRATMARVAFRYYPPADSILRLITPKAALAPLMEIWSNIEQRLSQRLERSNHHIDLVSHINFANEAPTDMYISRSETEMNILALVVAGSESVTTVLAGATNYLLREPTKLETLVSEIRSAFRTEEEITGTSVGRLPYLTAVLQEAMRLCPTIPDGMRRVVPDGGATVAGKFLPGGITVSVPQWAAYRSSSNFTSPSSFVPERWLTHEQQSEIPSRVPSLYALDRRDGFHPFSLGSHNCPGKTLAFLEMRLILTKLMWHFDLMLAETEIGGLPIWEKQDIFWFWVKEPIYVQLRNVR